MPSSGAASDRVANLGTSGGIRSGAWQRFVAAAALSAALAAGPAAAQAGGSATPAPAEPGKPDVVRMVGPVAQDLDLRQLPHVPPRVSFERRRLMRHPPSDLSSTEEEQEEGDDVLDEAPWAPEIVDEAFALRDAAKLASAQTPTPSISFDGINSTMSGCGCLPPDTDGDVGPNHYIQSVNSSIKIFDKSGGVLLAQASYNSFFAGLGTGVPCGNAANDGDGVVFYDHLADRWVVSDFAFPAFPGTSFYQCIGVSKTPDPVGGGWYLYAVQVDPSHPSYLGDYPKLGLWPDGYYMTMNEFSNNTTFNGVRVYALDRKSMVQGLAANAIGFSIDPATLGDQYSLVPATFRFGAPPAGEDEFLLSVNSSATAGTTETAVFGYRFHADFTTPVNSTFGSGVSHGPNAAITVDGFVDAFTGAGTLIVPQTGTAALLDTLGDKLMYPLYYQNLNGDESLWASQTIFASGTSGPTAIRWYQFDVSGGTLPAAPAQQQTFSNGADGLYRFMPSLALDSNGNLAINYSVSGSAVNPSIRYAARKPADPLDSLAQGEALLVQGAGHQTSGSGRWGDYSATGVDVADGCTFWMTNEYFSATSSSAWNTRIGAFSFPDCLLPTGTLNGTVTRADTAAPISGATVTAAASTSTDGVGFYQMTNVPVGVYTVTANAPGFLAKSAGEVSVDPNATTVQDLALAVAPDFACLTDTSLADFQAGTPASVDLTSSPGDVKLALTTPGSLDQSNTTLGATGNTLTSNSREGQSFVPAVSGAITQVDVSLFCSTTCTVTGGPITVQIRDATGATVGTRTPGNTILASATIPGFASSTPTSYTATFASPAVVTAGTSYTLVLIGAANTGTYAATRSAASNPYANGGECRSTNGVTWTSPSNTDLGFKVYVSPAYSSAGTLISSLKDSSLAGAQIFWSTLSFTATTPANTSVQFQAAASNSPDGPFSFVGPDNTASTYFTTSGASLAQFDGSRYLEYEAFLSSSEAASTPTLSDVTVCAGSSLQADLSITKTDGVTTATPGGSVTYTITASNGGPSDATGATVADTFPAALTCTWTCVGAGAGTCTASGSGDVDDTVDLPAGGSVTYTASCAISPAATGTLSNTATVTAPGDVNDPTPGNNTATDSDTLGASADLAITKTDGVTTATPGGSVTYTITASNAGPSSASGATVADAFPAPLTCTWTCVGSGGGTCTASGSGNVNDAVNLPAGGSATYTASCTISPAASGTLSNTATVTAPGGVTDPTPGNNSATDSDTLGAQADLSITKTDGVAVALPNGTLTYTITAANAGPSDAPGSTVADSFAASLTCTWTCAGAGGGTCTASGSGTINDGVDLPSGASVTYTASCTVSALVTGSVDNTATVAPPDGVADPVPSNNSATDSDIVPGAAVFSDGFESGDLSHWH